MMSSLLASSRTEMTLRAGDGLKIAAVSWKSTGDPAHRILALHGWMDNAATFHYLAPYLAEHASIEVVAIDFIGHGLSDHKSADGGSAMLAEGAYYVAEAIQQLEWSSFALLGHSMGAAVSCVYAAAFPEKVDRLVLLEGAGPLARNPRQVAQHVRAHVQRRLKPPPKAPRIYESLADAVEVRCRTAQNFPGNQYLSREAATMLVQRGSRSMGGEQVQFRHDPRLTYPSLQYFSQEQVEALYQDIQCPTCLLLAKDGWPLEEEQSRRVVELLQPGVKATLPGSHHFHADPDTSQAVAEHVVKFLEVTANN